MSRVETILDALKAVCADLEAVAPSTPSLHFAKGLLAAGVAPIMAQQLIGRAGLPAQEVIEKYRMGKGGPELAKEYGVSDETIYRLLMRFGINGQGRPRGPKGKHLQIAERAAELYNAGLSLLDVAAELGVSGGTVKKALDFANVDMRPKGPHFCNDERDARIEAILEMRREGASGEEIGAKLGVTRERVRQIVKAAGRWADYSERPLRPEEKAAAAEYANGATLEYIAAKLGVSTHRAKTVVAKAGIPVRPNPRRIGAENIARAEKAAVLYREGARLVDIANAVGYRRPEQVYRLLAMSGIRPSRRPRAVRAA